MDLKEKLIFGLDVPAKKAPETIAEFQGVVGMMKVNRLYFTMGREAIYMINDAGHRAFVDLKWKDTMDTLIGYVQDMHENYPTGIGMFNIHALNGFEKMAAVVTEVNRLYGDSPDRPKVVAVTIPTDMDGEDLKRLGIIGTPQEAVLRLANLAKEAGCDGVVASSEEVALIKAENGSNFLTVTPAIRFVEDLKAPDKSDCQKRIGTIDFAIGAGSDYLVMARPLLARGRAGAVRANSEIEAAYVAC